MTARWELLTHDNKPVLEFANEDLSHRPPTEMDPAINCNYGFKKSLAGVAIYEDYQEDEVNLAKVCIVKLEEEVGVEEEEEALTNSGKLPSSSH
jgi:hypothetical protein